MSLQFFGEGGDGGSSGGDGGTSTSGATNQTGSKEQNNESDIPAFIPERARKTYRKAQQIVAERNPEATKATKATAEGTITPDNAEGGKETQPEEKSFADIINDEKYKDERKKYLDSVFSSRFSKYKTMEAEHKAMQSMLSTFGGKYGLDPASETFMDDLKKEVEADEEFFANYAAEHGVPTEVARDTAKLKARIASLESEQREREDAVKRQQQVEALRKSAERTKAEFPEFDLDTEMGNPDFVKKCAALGGDTTTAYKIVHWNDLFNRARTAAAERAKEALSQSIASGQARPSENGLNRNSAPVSAQPDFRGMNTKELKDWYFKHRGK